MKKNTNLIILASLALVILISFSVTPLGASASTLNNAKGVPNVGSPSAVLIDADTGTLLYDLNSKEHRPVASMVKIMTLLLAFEAIDNGQLAMDERITVSENASSMGGSQAFLDAHAEYEAEQLIKAIIIASANDACVAIAERLSGSVEGFVSVMNQKATELGMNDTNFVNCTGLPAPNQYSCAYDASLMFKSLIKHEKYFEYSRVFTFDFEHPSGRKTMLTNTNKLVRAYEGCDGGKTGFTNEAMYCLSATAMRNGTRLICVVTGASTSKIRNAEICKLFDYGFANFETRQVIFSDREFEEKLSIPWSKEKETPIRPSTDGFHLINRGEDFQPTYEISIDEKVALPLPAGSVVGKILVCDNGELIAESEIVTTVELTEMNYLDYLNELIRAW
ncbi:MAG: D-alanyl-D-alanine carboxypeptidase [Clostridia bacterium]|nr:D-alanyl-D-alanine carboxypeptidase [Clostridia bacterium]